MKNLCKALLLCSFLFCFAARAEAFPSIKTVILPLEDTDAYHSKEVDQLVADRLRDHFRYPFYEKDFVALPEAVVIAGKKSTDRENMAALAKIREAGLVIGVELIEARAQIKQPAFFGWDRDRDTYVDTRAEIRICAYSAGDGLYRSWPAKLSREEVMTVNSGVKPAVEELLEKLLKELPYQRLPKVE